MFSKSSLIPIGILLCTACSFKKESQGKLRTAPFELTPVSLLKAQLVETDKDWGLPSKKLFYLKTCVLDSKTRNPRIGEAFTVSGNVDLPAISTDAEGCLVWTESVEFRYLENEKGIGMSRKLSSADFQRTLDFSIDPWSESVFPGLSLAPSASEARSTVDSHLRVANVQFSNLGQNQNGRKATVKHNLSFELETVRQKIGGAMEMGILPKGKFAIYLSLHELAPDQNSRRELSRADFIGSVSSGRLSGNTLLELAGLPHPSSALELHYRLEPIADRSLLQPVAGAISIPNLTETASAAPREDTSIPNAHNLPPNRSAFPSLPLPAGFRLRDWRVDFAGEVSFYPTSGLQEIHVLTMVCMEDPLTKKAIINHPFFVSLTEENLNPTDKAPESAQRSDERGCISWSTRLAHSEYSRERFLPYLIKIRSETTPYSDNSAQQTIFLNPWQRGEYFSWDTRRGSVPNFRTTEPEIRLTQVNWEFLNRNWKVTPGLALSSQRHYQLVMSPSLVRKHSVDQGPKPQALRPDVKVNLTVTFAALRYPVKNGAKAEEVHWISTYKTSARADWEGRVVVPVVLSNLFSEGPLLESKLKILLKLDIPNSGLKPASWLAQFHPLQLQGTSPVVNDPVMIQKVEAEYSRAPRMFHKVSQSPDSQLEASAPANETPALSRVLAKFSSIPNFEFIELEDPNAANQFSFGSLRATGISLSEIVAILDKNQPATDLISRYGNWYSKRRRESDGSQGSWRGTKLPIPPPSDFVQYQTKPSRFVSVGTLTLIEDLHRSEPISVRQDYQRLDLAAAFYRETIHSTRVFEGKQRSLTHEAGLQARLGIDYFGNGVTVFSGTSYRDQSYSGSEETASRDLRASLQALDTQSLNVERLELTLDATVRKCLWLHGKQGSFDRKPVPTYLFCSKRQEWTSESWYYLSDSNRPTVSPQSDPKEPTQRFIKLIRGKRAWNQFRNTASNPTGFYLLVPNDDQKASDDFAEDGPGAGILGD